MFLSDRDFHPTVGAYSQAHVSRHFVPGYFRLVPPGQDIAPVGPDLLTTMSPGALSRAADPSSRERRAKSGAKVAENMRCMFSVVLKPKRERSDEFLTLEQALETLLPVIDKPRRCERSKRESDRSRSDWNLSEITIFLIVILTFVVPIYVAFMMYARL